MSRSGNNNTSFEASLTPNASIASKACKASIASLAAPPSKVLIITYYWPPSGGAGVQRWLRFSKYMPQLGWEPVILTIDPEYATYPALDSSLEKDVPQGIEVYRTKATDWFSIYDSDKSKIPSSGFAKTNDNSLKEKLFRFLRGNFFIPDPRKGWNKYAFRKACEIIEASGIKHVITTSPPHSTQLIGLKIKNKYPGIKWIADLRDPWTDIYYYKQFYPTFISKKIDSLYERRVLKKADRIITVGPSLKTAFASKIKFNEDKIEVVTNGYDEDDFKGIEIKNPSRFTITYVGTLSDKYPLDGILGALIKIKINEIDFLLRFVGTVPENIRETIVSEISPDSIEFIPYTHHDEAITYMINSSMLLLVIPEHKNNKNIITGKIFEYIASGKPVLCLGPEDGDAAAILRQCSSGKCYAYKDINNIESFILSVISNAGSLNYKTDEFSHKNIAKKLVSFLK
jgi:glycosyltransferase involved in cell wall biosynthesis